MIFLILLKKTTVSYSRCTSYYPKIFGFNDCNPYAKTLLEDTDYLIIDELNEFINSKRGDQLALAVKN